MNELTFRLIYKPHSPGFEVPWIEDNAGRLRRASAEEEALWKCLLEANKRIEEQEQRAPKRR